MLLTVAFLTCWRGLSLSVMSVLLISRFPPSSTWMLAMVAICSCPTYSSKLSLQASGSGMRKVYPSLPRLAFVSHTSQCLGSWPPAAASVSLALSMHEPHPLIPVCGPDDITSLSRGWLLLHAAAIVLHICTAALSLELGGLPQHDAETGWLGQACLTCRRAW